jgi:hypothetical protein
MPGAGTGHFPPCYQGPDAADCRLHAVAGTDVRRVDMDDERLIPVLERRLLLDPPEHVIAGPNVRPAPKS